MINQRDALIVVYIVIGKKIDMEELTRQQEGINKWKLELFLNNSIEKFGKKYSYPYLEEEYSDSHSKITIKCNDCGNIFHKRAGDHLQSSNGGCKTCAKAEKEECYSFERIINEIKDKDWSSLEIKPFDGLKFKSDKVVILCPVHGEYELKISSILKGLVKCKKCASQKYVDEKRIDKDKFLKLFQESEYSSKIEPLIETYIKFDIPMEFRCKECGHVFKRKPTLFMHNYGFKDYCPNCALQKISQEHLKTTEQFVQECVDKYGTEKYDFSKTVYTGSSKKVTITCKECGRDFTIEANSFLSGGHGCPYHYRNKSMKEDEIVDMIKKELFIEKVLTNDRIALDGKEIDIYLPDCNLGIEFDGVFWHSDDVKGELYHQTKSLLAENKGITLIHIFEDEWHGKKEFIKSAIAWLSHRPYPMTTYIPFWEFRSLSDEILQFIKDNYFFLQPIDITLMPQEYLIYKSVETGKWASVVGFSVLDGGETIHVHFIIQKLFYYCPDYIHFIDFHLLSKYPKTKRIVVDIDLRYPLWYTELKNYGYKVIEIVLPQKYSFSGSERFALDENKYKGIISDAGKLIVERFVCF